ncbi:hypothetical protein SAMN05444354_107259 [Stigmatella aurantiaca]|uniref:Lipoprotein n=1 Tax=Stigmatella aurantiaca TaxID=41 RepID=A0A1H7S313_STIAU|nr:hypothetical protein [Stigmatella aurantiaca]SEL65937.1 hypothetical protein SAMN05444354_107259 [Stigmatella aurantiaca]
MHERKSGALLLTLMMVACASTPRPLPGPTGLQERELEVVRYELRVLTAGTGGQEPVQVDGEDFRKAMRMLASGLRPSRQPREVAHWLIEGGLQTHLLAEMQRGKVAKLTPQEEDGPLLAETAAQVTRSYLKVCQQQYGGGDCLGLLEDGPTLQREDLRMLALALALSGVLSQAWMALQETVSPQSLVAMIVWTGGLYLTLWLLPEPASKLLAASLTVALLAWLPVATLWELMDGWARLVHEVDRATTFAQVQAASERFSKVMGQNTARVLIMAVTAVLSGSVAKLAQQLPKLPGFSRAAAQAEAAGVNLAEAAAVQEVSAAGEGTFTLMVRNPSGKAPAAGEAHASIRTIIRHQGGNRQVHFNGQRWHVPAHKEVGDIPSRDPVGDQLQAVAQGLARNWGLHQLRRDEAEAIRRASVQGKRWLMHLLERQARGRFVENELRQQFPQLRWNPKGVDAVDPTTGYRYEVLSGTDSNLALHGRRLAKEFFRLITF